MLIGKLGAAKSAIAEVTATGVGVRGRDLAGDLMGGITFTGYFYFLLTGQEPSETQREGGGVKPKPENSQTLRPGSRVAVTPAKSFSQNF